MICNVVDICLSYNNLLAIVLKLELSGKERD